MKEGDEYGAMQFDFYWFHVRFEIHVDDFHVYTKYGNNEWKLIV